MSSIKKELNDLAIKIGAPVVGENISEQIRAINTHLGGSSNGANISERIDELTKVFNSGGSGTGSSIAAAGVLPAYGMSKIVTIKEE